MAKLALAITLAITLAHCHNVHSAHNEADPAQHLPAHTLRDLHPSNRRALHQDPDPTAAPISPSLAATDASVAASIAPGFRNLMTALNQTVMGRIAVDPAVTPSRAPGCKKLIWFTTLGVRANGVLEDSYASFTVPALLSALRQAPSLVPHLIYDGPGNPPIVQWWRAMGGVVHYHHLAFYDMLQEVSRAPYHPVGFINLAAAFLRFDIPLVLKDYQFPDDVDPNYVLYTDVDSMFLKDIDSCSFAPHPNFRMGPESTKGEIINAGVMYINLQGWAQHRGGMIDWGRAHHWTMVQPILLNYFANGTNGGIGHMEDRFNWKGYWGRNDDAVVIHFHGPKPGQCLECYVLHSSDIQYCADKYHVCQVYKVFWTEILPDGGAFFQEVMQKFYFYLGLATSTMV